MKKEETKLVGILNLTPDSFSDGGSYNCVSDILKHTEKLISDGAGIIDIGAESTRYGADSLSHDQEFERLLPSLKLVIDLAKENGVLTSLDTRNYLSARKAIELGIDWVNDVSGFSDSKMIGEIKNNDTKLVVMHSLTVPADKNILIDESADPVSFVKNWAKEKINYLRNHSISKERIILDPGIGFGKNAKQSLEIIRRIVEFADLGVQILVGHSRKSFFNELTDVPFAERDLETVSASLFMKNYVDYFRVHNVEFHKRSFKVFDNLSGAL